MKALRPETPPRAIYVQGHKDWFFLSNHWPDLAQRLDRQGFRWKRLTQ